MFLRTLFALVLLFLFKVFGFPQLRCGPVRGPNRSLSSHLRYRKNPIELNNDESAPQFSRKGGGAGKPTRYGAKIRKKQNEPSDGTSIERMEDDEDEAMFSVAYDPLQLPDQTSLERDLEDMLMERALRFYDEKLVRTDELCYLVGLEDKSTMSQDKTLFTMEESLTELSELAGAAGLTVIGSTYQRMSKPDIQYYIGAGKTIDIRRAMIKNKCTCVIIDAELSPSQQKNLEISFNQESSGRTNKNQIKVVDRTALILDIFAQHARTKEGKLQVQLAMLTYRLPRLTNMWTHLERQSAGARGKSNGGVGLRGPGETQLESDRRQMNKKISILNRSIDQVRRHRKSHRSRRRRLGVPVVALVGYTNAGKSTLLNTLAGMGAQVYAADMLFATLDPTTRLIRMSGLKNPNMLLTDTVGFIQKLPTNLVAAFRATLEEITEADVLLHITDVNSESWRKQEAAVLKELSAMGLEEKPVVTVWNKIDACPERKEFLKLEASKRSQTVALSAATGEGIDEFKAALEEALANSMMYISLTLPYDDARATALLSSIHDLGVLEEVSYNNDGIYVRGSVPEFLQRQVQEVLDNRSSSLWMQEGALIEEEESLKDDGDLNDMCTDDAAGCDARQTKRQVNRHVSVGKTDRARVGTETDKGFTDWKQLAKGRHTAIREYEAHLAAEEEEKGMGEESAPTQDGELSEQDVDQLVAQGLDPNGLLDFDDF
jgi:GTP-binding protein HflX